MKILYLSCHSVLEYDEVKLLHELGHEVFSPGAYIEPHKSGDSMRPEIPNLTYNSDILAEFHAIHDKFPGEDNKDHLYKEFIDHFDCVIVMHVPKWITNNWHAMKHKRVIWRTIGQSVPTTEVELEPYRKQGLQIVRYSPKERTLDRFIGEDALIRFYKDPNDYGPWNGEQKKVITFGQSMEQRNAACNYDLFQNVTAPFDRHLFGPGNEGKNWTTGKVSYERLKEEMCNNRAYFYTGTHPASYTLNFIEAWMTGIPIVGIGPSYGNASYFPGVYLYEVNELIDNKINGFISDDPQQLRYYISELLNNHSLAQQISNAGRKKAIEIFGKETIKSQWENFLND
jgi:hypothetical protein